MKAPLVVEVMVKLTMTVSCDTGHLCLAIIYHPWFLIDEVAVVVTDAVVVIQWPVSFDDDYGSPKVGCYVVQNVHEPLDWVSAEVAVGNVAEVMMSKWIVLCAV